MLTFETFETGIQFSVFEGFPGGGSGGEPTCHCRRQIRGRFHPWVRKFPWRRAGQPTPVFLPRESHAHSSLVGATVHWVSKSQTWLKWLSLQPFYLFLCWLVDWFFSLLGTWKGIVHPGDNKFTKIGACPVLFYFFSILVVEGVHLSVAAPRMMELGTFISLIVEMPFPVGHLQNT